VAAAGAAALAAAAVVLATESRGTSSPGPAGVPLHAALPDPVPPAFRVRTPRPLDDGIRVYHSAPVLRHVQARAAPEPVAAPVAALEQLTPEGTTNIVLAVGRARDARGRLWVRIRLPVLPNGSTGWVPRSALGGYVEVRTRLLVNRARLTATLLRDGRPIFSARVGVGVPASPTPSGDFYVRNKLTNFDNPFYGPVAFGTSGRSPVLTDWPGGGFIGIHGTNQPELLPGRVSHGCIRLRNEDILELARLMTVGTPVTIV
jgi:lipoprotein-anchoring transpeptidase ErfK/SrfK